MTLDELAAKMDKQFENLEQKMDQRFESVDQRFESLEQKMDQGFNDSKIRDERLQSLMTFGLESREILRDEMLRRFDAADRKSDQQLELLRDAFKSR